VDAVVAQLLGAGGGPEDHRGLPPRPRPRESDARPLLQEGPRRGPGILARGRGARGAARHPRARFR
jgi:hypothetical protein